MRENRYVKFIGNCEELLCGLPEKEELLIFFKEVNKFLVTDKVYGKYEIFMNLGDESHYFYVEEDDIEAI